MHEAAVTLGAAYEQLCQRYGVRPPMGAGLIPGYDWQTEDSAAALAPDVAARAAAHGAAMSLDDALDYILDLLPAPPAG
jgi:hypothetical protein